MVSPYNASRTNYRDSLSVTFRTAQRWTFVQVNGAQSLDLQFFLVHFGGFTAASGDRRGMRKCYAELNPPHRLLLGPGPSSAEPRVLRAMAAPLLGQFDPAFTDYMNDVV